MDSNDTVTPDPAVIENPESAAPAEAPTLPPKRPSRFRFSWKRFVTVMSILIGLCLIAYAVLFFYLDQSNALPIKQVKVIGSYQYVDEQDIQKTVNPFLLGKGLFAFSEWQAEKALEQLPGVQDASVWRIYPGTIRIILREKSAVARLPDGRLLASDGSTFSITNLSGSETLPLLSGQIFYTKQMLAMYDSITPVFAAENMQVTGLGLAENGDWSIQLNHQFWIMLGKRHIQDRVVDFLTDYPALIASAAPGQQLSQVDLRYVHGFTASWQQTAPVLSGS